MHFIIPRIFRRPGLRQHRLAAAIGTAMLTCGWFVPAMATTVQQKSLSDLVKGAELVFEGTVTGSTVEPGPNGNGARSCFTFQVIDVIAGTPPSGPLSLCFMGGEIAGRHFVVSGMRYPVVGEHGIYLVESTHEAIVNPLIGWDQGHFLIQADPATGTPRMMTAAHRRVMAIGAEAAQPTAKPVIVSPSGATAAGVESDDAPDLAGALSRDDFKSRLRAFVGR